MKADRLREIEHLFHAACADRGVLAGADSQVRREVELLLAQDEAELPALILDPLGEEADAGSREDGSAPPHTRNPQTLIGRYRLLRKIGEGGMGEVWLAQQEAPVRRDVALKMIRAGTDNREMIARFESERQTLALMNHPAIARVYDAGSAPDGTPYLAMEYTPGVPITTYCDENRVSIHQRLMLFMQACEGVQHAHQKAIIHRDLKPSNILVSETDGQPAPKIIDFGVAKALQLELNENTLLTQAGVMIGTPEYMSPEQADTSNEDIDTRTDVYSLGVVFYRLLTGAPPIDLRKIPLDEYLRRLRQEEPEKPSAKIRMQSGDAVAELARLRSTEPGPLVKQIRGDLDSIALKALAKSPSRRYSSASELAADIARYLRSEPVLAVPPSASYRAGRFARRHRGALSALAALLVVLIAATVISVRQSILAGKAAEIAEREAAVSQAVRDFLQNDLLAQADTGAQSEQHNKPDPDLKVRTALDRAAARVAGKFDKQPEVEAAIRDTIGRTYLELALYREARQQLARAQELHRKELGDENQKTLESATGVGRAAFRMGDYAVAERLHSRTLEVQRRVLGTEHPDTLESMNDLADVYIDQNKYVQAEKLLVQTIATRRRVLGPEHRETLGAMNDLADVYDLQGDYERAEALYRETLEIASRVLGPEHPWTLSTLSNLAIVYDDLGKYAEAELLHKKVIGVASHLLGTENGDTLQFTAGLANTYRNERRFAEAEALYLSTLAVQSRVFGTQYQDTVLTRSYLASMYQRQGRYALAEVNAAEVLAAWRSGGSNSGDGDTMDAAADLATACQAQGKFSESLSLAQEALAFDRDKRPDDWQRFRAEAIAGASLAGLMKFTEAEPMLLGGYRGMLARKDRIAVPDRYHLDLAHQWVVQLYRAWGKPEPAGAWEKKQN